MNEIVKIDLFGEEFRFKPDDQVENPEKVAKYLKNYIKQAENMFQNKASGKNKIAILIPCHRVVGSNGEITGYAGGVDKKIWMLEHEIMR